MRQKRYKRKMRVKHQRWLVSLVLIISIFLLFQNYFLTKQSSPTVIKYKSYLTTSENISNKYEELHFFLNKIMVEQEKLEAFLQIGKSNDRLRMDFLKTKETIGIPTLFEMQNLLTDDNIIYLTFDDGPTPSTKTIIDLLDSYGQKATFFMLEPRMRKYNEQLTYLIEKGHQPALHGVTHQLEIFYKDKDSVVREMDIANATLTELGGVTSYIIRTPYGSFPHMKEDYFTAVEENGYYLFDWTIDSLDWKYPTEKFVTYTIDQLQNNRELANKPKVILMHDKETTARHLEELLIYLKENGYKTDVIDYRYYGYSF